MDEQDVQNAISRDGRILHMARCGRISTVQTNGTLTLLGKAKSFYEKQLAQECFREVVNRENLLLKNEIVVE